MLTWLVIKGHHNTMPVVNGLRCDSELLAPGKLNFGLFLDTINHDIMIGCVKLASHVMNMMECVTHDIDMSTEVLTISHPRHNRNKEVYNVEDRAHPLRYQAREALNLTQRLRHLGMSSVEGKKGRQSNAVLDDVVVDSSITSTEVFDQLNYINLLLGLIYRRHFVCSQYK